MLNSNTCRDCGSVLEGNARGCPTCALNLEAENMIDRFIWRQFMPGVFIAAVLAAAALLYFLR